MSTSQMVINIDTVNEFAGHLRNEEKSLGTIDNYLRDVRRFIAALGDKELTKEFVTTWKENLLTRGYKAATVNRAVAAVNSFFKFIGRDDCRVTSVRVQKKTFRDPGRELTRGEYRRLLEAARRGGETWLPYVLEALYSTGARVSELRWFTVEALKGGRVEIWSKGKVRTILFTEALRKKLFRFAKEQKITSGEIFLSGGRKPLDRRRIWAAMKSLAEQANVKKSKVFPHNLRHLFAEVFYGATKDIDKLATILGHSSTDTTRLYLMTSGEEILRILESLRLVS